MKRKFIITIITLCILLCGCSNNDSEQIADNPYVLSNGLTPTKFIEQINDVLLDIYVPANQKMIDDSIIKFSELATSNEVSNLQQSLGTYDSSKRAKMSNLQTTLCMPDNSSSHTYKVISTFNISLKGVEQNMLIEFICDSTGKIADHSIWSGNIINR